MDAVNSTGEKRVSPLSMARSMLTWLREEGAAIVLGETVDVDVVSLLPLVRSMLSRCSQWREAFHVSNAAIASCETPSRHACHSSEDGSVGLQCLGLGFVVF